MLSVPWLWLLIVSVGLLHVVNREYGRVSRQLMACLNGLLLTYGADLRPQLPTTHKALSTYIRHAWTAHTNVPIKVRMADRRRHEACPRECAVPEACPRSCPVPDGHVVSCKQCVCPNPTMPNDIPAQVVSLLVRLRLGVHVPVPCSVLLQDGVLCYCRLSVALGGAQAVGTSLNDLLDLVSREINAPSFTW